MKSKLARAIQRSELAYSYYKENKHYFQALRIYEANKLVYSLLQEFLLESEEDQTVVICDYMFHLEDWFNQFEEEVQKQNIALHDQFVFTRLENMIPFPKEFKKILI